MSLKAKLEAVIYAAEEPVTLAQLAQLFDEDALAWKVEQDAALAASREAAAVADGAAELADSTQELSDLLPAAETEEPTTAVEAVAQTEEAADPEVEAKRLERKREREVREILRGVLDELIAEYAQNSRGIEIREIAGGFRMGTKPEIHDAVRAFVKSLKPPLKLSLPALETLAVIAYKQPVTAPEVGEIRGVDSAGVLGSLMSRKLIATAGRKQVIGRPMLYKTTKEFLLRFGLKDLSELPSMEEFEKMAAMELSEETLEEGEPMDEEQAVPVEKSGDLFAEAEQTGGDLSKANVAGPVAPATGGDLSKANVVEQVAAQTGGDLSKSNIAKPVTETVEAETPAPASNKGSTEVDRLAAEASEEAAEEDAPVERRSGEEIGVER